MHPFSWELDGTLEGGSGHLRNCGALGITELTDPSLGTPVSINKGYRPLKLEIEGLGGLVNQRRKFPLRVKCLCAFSADNSVGSISGGDIDAYA